MQRNVKVLSGVSLAVVAVVAMVGLNAQLDAQTPLDNLPPVEEPNEQAEAETTAQPEQEQSLARVGTYDPQAVFQAHPAQEKLMQEIQTAQTEMQEAQQDNDQEKMQTVQQQFEQKRRQIVQEFEKDIEEALPQAAEAAGVKVIALEVVYTADDVQAEDLTQPLIQELTKDDGTDEGNGQSREPIQIPGQG